MRTLAVHGGAGPWEGPVRATADTGLEGALDAGWSHQTALEMVVAAVRALEDNPVYNAGIGATFNSAGYIEHDAGLMEGTTLRVGGVGAIRALVRHPVDLARAVMEDGRHVVLVADGAAEFARAKGVELADSAIFETERRRGQLEEWKRVDTVGAVARDADGRFAVAVSTGGYTGKLPGRVGDSPIPGGGFYADDRGGPIWPRLLGAEEHGIRIVDTRHEQTATFAAEGWSKVTRQCGVASVTAGPGVANALSAIAAAHSNDSPLLVIGGRAPEARWGMGSLQEIHHVPVVTTPSKRASTPKSAEAAYALVIDSLQTALTARTGPVFFDVPFDTFLAAADLPEQRPEVRLDRGAGADPDEVAKAAALIRGAAQPAVIAGTGVYWAHAEEQLRAFAERTGVPVYLNGLGRGCLPPDHPSFRSRSRSVGLGEADLVVVVGVPLDFRLNFGQPPVMREDAQIIYVDCDDFRKHRPGAAALYGDIATSLAALAESGDGAGAGAGAGRRSGWLERLGEKEKSSRERDRAVAGSDAGPLH